MIIHNFSQRSEEWFNIRKGKFTASNAQAIASQGAGLDTEVLRVLKSMLSGKVQEEKVKSSAMEDGVEREEPAKFIFSAVTGKEIKEVGFIEYNDYVGCSPDGIIIDESGDSLIEIKCPDDEAYLKYLLSDKIDSKYYLQMQAQLFMSNAHKCFYMIYNPNFDLNYQIREVQRDEPIIKQLEIGYQQAIVKLQEKLELYKLKKELNNV